ncbi:glycosyltransferase family 2 protein [Gymnopus androsaceus JB14]|uniref:chitin synthase n=1 Tax=Gymnopus androsaceus JB14 TaxID=1447944 RepID=A0A6A4GTH3_9AGAR|nr:glycosyltransferase family 2 protein [Gymnopus androsaceus JB14]
MLNVVLLELLDQVSRHNNNNNNYNSSSSSQPLIPTKDTLLDALHFLLRITEEFHSKTLNLGIVMSRSILSVKEPVYQNQLSPGLDDVEYGGVDPARVGRKKSLVRPDREKIEPGHRQWHYRTRIAQAEEDGARVEVHPSKSGLALFKRGNTLLRKKTQSSSQVPMLESSEPKHRSCLGDFAPGPKGPWMVYCYLLTILAIPPLLRACGMRTPEQQRAWREKIGLISIVLGLMAGVGFITFGFTEVVCGTPPNTFHGGAIGDENIGTSSVTINGYDYDFSNFKHPAAGSTFNGSTNPLITGGWDLGGNDASFLFQNVNQNCLGLITRASGSSITGSGNDLDWYFPCNVKSQYGTTSPNTTGSDSTTNCHASSTARTDFSEMSPQGQVYFTWSDVHSTNRSLAVYEAQVLDLELLNWLSADQVNYPSVFDDMRHNTDGIYNGNDITMLLYRTNQKDIGACLKDIVTVGFIDSKTIGCLASDVVLYLSLIFIIGVVAIRFGLALWFFWFESWKIGNFPRETYEQRMQRATEIENWSNDIYRPAPSQYRPNVNKKGGVKLGKPRKSFLPSTSRFTPSDNLLKTGRASTAYGMLDSSSTKGWKNSVYAPSLHKKGTPPDSPGFRGSKSIDGFARGSFIESPCPFPLHNVVPQPPPDYEPFNFPLVHTIALVTAYSESVEGLRTTLDSLATTDYPNSHKFILVIADGMVKGAGNDMTTPDIVISMMKEFIIPPSEVEPHSYVAIADGHKRHNMAKVYAGFYNYDDATTEKSKQQRVPIVLVAKCGNPLEANDAKPGNRGKRDSQIVLMAFLQKVMFDERMTTFEYEFFNSIWRVTGVSPDRYELVLCVDADTKVFPDSLTRMTSCFVHDEEIMGLCGETKIANKGETWVTMMQVFEYYISHHMTKAFESMFGGVTCLPGCFSMYRIKAPKGDSGYWVPILANPDIVEHYSENVVDTLHKKNLLLLGEDRYLTTLLLKTFPKRKNIFCPQAVCKTVVPIPLACSFPSVQSSYLVRDLCGTFCFSMQFVVGMDLGGTLVLPAAISFTLYVIIESIIPGGSNTTIPLILLAMILGLPGLLIVVTSRKIAYVGWMLTRMISGDKTGAAANHGDKEGEFDSTHIVMKKWAEFERERRWKSGTQSRDSMFYNGKTDSNRYSLGTDSDTFHPPSNGFDSSTIESAAYATPRQRHDSNTLLMLPAPLAVNRQPMSSNSSVSGARSSEDAHYSDHSDSNLRLVPSLQSDDAVPSNFSAALPSSRYSSPGRSMDPPQPRVNNFRSPTSYYSDVSNPFSTPSADSDHAYTAEPEEMATPSPGPGPGRAGGRSMTTGVRLTDGGPVPSAEGGVRRVTRPSGRRPQSQNRYSRSSTAFSLPPGAAPPQPTNFGGFN